MEDKRIKYPCVCRKQQLCFQQALQPDTPSSAGTTKWSFSAPLIKSNNLTNFFSPSWTLQCLLATHRIHGRGIYELIRNTEQTEFNECLALNAQDVKEQTIFFAGFVCSLQIMQDRIPYLRGARTDGGKQNVHTAAR